MLEASLILRLLVDLNKFWFESAVNQQISS